MNFQVTVNVYSTKYKAQDDQQIYGVELNETNQYRNTFTGTLIHIHDHEGYVVNSDGRIIICDINMLNVTVA